MNIPLSLFPNPKISSLSSTIITSLIAEACANIHSNTENIITVFVLFYKQKYAGQQQGVIK